MSDFVIFGGKPLRGNVTACGSKNAVLPIIFATVATVGVSVIENVPDISDVDKALLLISELGAVIKRRGTTLTVDTRKLSYKTPNADACSSIRASTYLMGAELARFGVTELAPFGGCSFEPRPIDLHIYAARCMGAKCVGRLLRLEAPVSSEIRFSKISVGATANALILASALPLETRIYGYAKEPHIKALADFLVSAGAKIEFSDENISVVGKQLSGAEAKIPPDPIETGTYALLSLLFDGAICVKGSEPSELSALMEPLCEAGASLCCSSSGFTLSGSLDAPVSFTAAPYPALATDLQPLTVPVLANNRGGEVRDTVFPGRFGYVSALRRFGLSANEFPTGVRVLPSEFSCGVATAPDLRGGAALLFPALLAKGESRIAKADLIKRGYGGVVEKLRRIGAEIYEI